MTAMIAARATTRTIIRVVAIISEMAESGRDRILLISGCRAKNIGKVFGGKRKLASTEKPVIPSGNSRFPALANHDPRPPDADHY
jgi:hypothetical protein